MSNSGKSFDEFHESIDTTTVKPGWRKLLAFLGPAYLVSVGYMDPGNWATDIAAGSEFGYALLWVIVLSNFTAILVQSHSARLGLVTGRDLAQFSRSYYPTGLNYIFWFLAEIAIAATDLAEVLGMAIGLNLLFGLDMLYGVLLSLFDTFLIMFLVKRGMRKLEAFIIALISIIGISFLIELFFSKPNIPDMLTGLIPSLENDKALYIAIGIIGATVMPHNLYLHSSLVQTRKYKKDEEGVSKAIKFNFIDTAIALNLALFVNGAILVLAASAFYTAGLHDIQDITDAHKMLEPLLGSVLAPTLFAIALIASGQSSTLTGTVTGQIVMEGYLNLRMEPWIRRLITRLLAVVPAFFTILIAGPGMAGELLILSQVILSVQLGFALIPLVHWVSSKDIMGVFRIRWYTQVLSWIAVGIIVALNVKLVADALVGYFGEGQHFWLFYGLVLPIVLLAIALLIYTLVEPFFSLHSMADLSSAHGTPGQIVLEQHGKFKKVAISVDFSESDSQAINYALAQGGPDTHYYLIHIVESAGARMLNSDIADNETRQDREHLEEYAAQLTKAGIQNSIIIDFGLPRIALPDAVKKVGADLLVMSSHGRGPIHRIIKGRTIAKVQAKVHVPIVIVK